VTDETWLVLGASSPIARAVARHVAERGRRVILAGRDLDDLRATAADLAIRGAPRVDVLPFDASDLGSHAAFAARCAELAGTAPLAVLVAFAFMPEQPDVDADPALVRRTVDATFTGAASVLHWLAPRLESQAGGRVVVLGSVAGDRGRPRNYVYGSAKAGLHAYLQGLRARLHRHRVPVTTVKLGFVDTAMTFGRPGTFLVASPESAAAAIVRHAERGADVRYVPSFWRPLMLGVRLIPERIFKRLDV
jgi:decaprenylphospho-beta-D-erythro-pentofuranosid-2-ulose 2-reductase